MSQTNMKMMPTGFRQRTSTAIYGLLVCFTVLVCAAPAEAAVSETRRSAWRRQALEKVTSLIDYRGREFAPGRTGHVLVFLRAGCPLADRYVRPLERLAEQHPQFSFTAVIPDDGPSHDQVMKWIGSRKPGIRTVIDSGELSEFFEAAVSPEAFVLDPQGELLYRGMIDDQHLPTRPSLAAPNHEHLRDVLDQMESGKFTFPRFTLAAGCHLQKVATEFNRHIAPVIYDRCAICHRPGDIKGDLPLTSYEQISAAAKTIEWRFDDRFMPPWRASHHGVEFSNDLSLSLNEIWRFSDWIRNDMPVVGEPASPPANLLQNKWRIPDPDAVVDIGEDFRVAAEGRIPYQYFFVKSPFEEDRWITATEVRPGASDVVHHINVFLLPPEDERDSRVRQHVELKLALNVLQERGDVVDPKSFKMVLLLYGLRLQRRIRFLSDFNPAETRTLFPNGTGFLLRKGAEIVFEIHYTPNGYSEVIDRSLLALHAARSIPENWQAAEPVTRVVGHVGRIKIPPGEKLTLTKELPFLADVELISLKPHMHYRGSEFAATLIDPDGKRQQLLHIPRWDYDFQMPYVFRTPVRAPKGSRLEVTYEWDNSTSNPSISEQDAKKSVSFGFQTEEEMSMAYPTYRYLTATAAEIQDYEARITEYLSATTNLPSRDRPKPTAEILQARSSDE